MLYTVIYFLLVALITFRLYKAKASVLGRIVFTYITIIGAFSVYAMYENTFPHVDITLIPYLFLVATYCIALSPFMKSSKIVSPDKVSVTIDKRYRYFMYLYVVCGIISLSWSYSTAIALMQSGEWATNYSETVGEGGAVYTYPNQLVWLAVQIASYTSLLAIVLSFLYLCDKRYILLSYISLFLFVANTISSAISVSSRGMLFNMSFLLLGMFVFFFRSIQKGAKKVIYIFAVLGAIVIVPYIIDVTVSRFSEDAAGDSVVNYFSQPPIIFNSGVAPIHTYSYGKRTLGFFMDDTRINQREVGGSWGSGFYTFVGWLYIDWGPIGTLLICAFFAYCLSQIVRKRKYEVSDLLLIFFYYKIMINGVLVLGISTCLSILMTMVLWALMKIFIENKKTVEFSA